jgi:hypothetical protein
MRIRILLLIKVMRISDHWSTDPPMHHLYPTRLYCEPPWINFEPLKLLNFDLDLDPDPANADPDPASKK